MRRYAPLLSLWLVSACRPTSRVASESSSTGGAPVTSSATITASPGVQFTLHLGETAVIQGRNVAITFRDVTGDSRCPVGVQCVWAGNATILVSTRNPSGSVAQTQLMLMANPAASNNVTIAGVITTFISLTPVPEANVAMDRTRYSATFTTAIR